MDNIKLLSKYRKKPIAGLSELQDKPGFSKLNIGLDGIKKIIPHREPFLLVGEIDSIFVDDNEKIIFGSKIIPNDEPILKGHFPGFPVYPGVLQIEMAGQLGLCLTYFVENNTDKISDDAKPVNIQLTKVLGAQFLSPVFPDKKLTIISKMIEYDSFLATAISQVICENKVCSVSMAEVVFMD